MKCTLNFIAVAMIVTIPLFSKAQSWVPNSGNLVTSNTNNVGIGTTTPSDKLTVHDGNISLTRSVDNQVRTIDGRTQSGTLSIGANLGQTGPNIGMYGVNNSWRPGTIWYTGTANSGAPAWGNSHVFTNFNPTLNTYVELMGIRDENGKVKVSIGANMTNPGDYALYVERGILTEKVRVALKNTADWSDYVFAADYDLMPLAKVEQYIQSNKHLPGVASAQEVKDNGIDVAQMDAVLLKKIEELTLYMLQQQKEIDRLKKQLEGKR